VDVKTTKTYMHIASVVFRDEADRLEARVLRGRGSTGMSESESTKHEPAHVTTRSGETADCLSDIQL
jgi:hypothetical protein